MKEIIDIVHKSILPFFDVCEKEEEPLTEKDKLLLKVNKAICNNLKALERESKWIPVSERLPERSDEYLVSVIDGLGEDDEYEAVRVAWFAHKKDYAIQESEWRELGINETVIAWMPLPKPYESQESETWNGIHAQITAPKGTFERIFNEADDDNDI